MTVTLIVRLKGNTGSGDALRAALQPMPTKNDIPGCLGWDVFTNNCDNDEILLLEYWENVEAHKAHIEKATASGDMDAVLAQVREVERTYYNQL
jgi:quinol monooxygenase YgiN